jgi:hypothetical protein
LAKTQTLKQFVNDYAEYLNAILNRTVTDSRLTLLAGPHPDIWLVTRYQNGKTLPLELRPSGFLFFRQLVSREIDPDPAVKDHIIVQEAVYTFALTENQDEDWVFRYEWNRSQSKQSRPHSHLHIKAVHPVFRDIDFERVHLPVGRLSIEQILAHLILEHGIEPKAEVRDTIIEELAESHRGFTRRRMDLDNPPFP